MLVVIVIACALTNPDIVGRPCGFGKPVECVSGGYDVPYNFYPHPDMWLDDKLPLDGPHTHHICDRSGHWNTERPLLFRARVVEMTASAVVRRQVLRNRGKRPRKRTET